jgi:DNA mismatch endonuclease, patch repair protein
MNRSDNMRRIRSKNTGPELAVRRLIWELGFPGYRLHRKDLPGKPDIAWIGRRLALFVHGCFWHGHDCAEGIRKPKTNQTYWIPKIERNRKRDAENIATLEANGWRVIVIWECELKDEAALAETLIRFLSTKTS